MALLTSVMRAHLKVLSPILKQGASLETARAFQNKMGELTALKRLFEAFVERPFAISEFEASWVSPRHPPKRGAVLYLHGGGYTAGDLGFAVGFGSVLASETGRRTLCPAYRLAPENPYPAALDDALGAYRALMDAGYSGEEIILCGESAGGGLCLALTLRLKELGLPLPAGLALVSPWVDLTLSGESYLYNERTDPSLSMNMLEYYAGAYAGKNRKDPLVSPIFGDLRGFPPCLLFVGGDEILLSDTLDLAEKLEQCGVPFQLKIEEKLWHAYVLYGIREANEATKEIAEFIEERIR